MVSRDRSESTATTTTVANNNNNANEQQQQQQQQSSNGNNDVYVIPEYQHGRPQIVVLPYVPLPSSLTSGGSRTAAGATTQYIAAPPYHHHLHHEPPPEYNSWTTASSARAAPNPTPLLQFHPNQRSDSPVHCTCCTQEGQQAPYSIATTETTTTSFEGNNASYPGLIYAQNSRSNCHHRYNNRHNNNNAHNHQYYPAFRNRSFEFDDEDEDDSDGGYEEVGEAQQQQQQQQQQRGRPQQHRQNSLPHLQYQTETLMIKKWVLIILVLGLLIAISLLIGVTLQHFQLLQKLDNSSNNETDDSQITALNSHKRHPSIGRFPLNAFSN